jgi:hypothetical protein
VKQLRSFTCFIFEYFFSKYALAVSARANALTFGSQLFVAILSVHRVTRQSYSQERSKDVGGNFGADKLKRLFKIHSRLKSVCGSHINRCSVNTHL